MSINLMTTHFLCLNCHILDFFKFNLSLIIFENLSFFLFEMLKFKKVRREGEIKNLVET
jgi:hypothetical protein